MAQQKQDSQEQYKDPVLELKQIQTTIVNKLEVLDGLNVEYKNKQERQFLKTFMHIMDKMSNQLVTAKEKYKNIDKQIEKDQRCVKLSKQLSFFKDQCLTLKKQLIGFENDLQQEKKTNQLLEAEKEKLSKALMKKQKQALKYKWGVHKIKMQQQNKMLEEKAEQITLDKPQTSIRLRATTNLKSRDTMKNTWYSSNINSRFRSTSSKNNEYRRNSVILSKQQ